MKKLFLLLTLVVAMSLTLTVQSSTAGNPLLEPYNTQFGIPPFEKIKPEHFMPAIKEAIADHEKEIQAIVDTKEAANFANTIEALEYSGMLLNNITTILFNLNSVVTNQEFQDLARESAPILSAHADKISQNKELFKRVKAVYDKKGKIKLNTEQKQLLEDCYRSFVRNGAKLNDEKQKRLSKVNEDLSLLELKFGENLLAETNAFTLVITNKEDLEGLPKGIIDAAAEAAVAANKKGQWLFTLHNPSVLPFLQYSAKRDLREKIWNAYTMRGNNGNANDNNVTLKEIANLRLERSKLLGYKSYADYSLEDAMAKNPKGVYKLLDQLWKPALKLAKKEAKELQAIIDRTEKKSFKLQPWDWRYYAEKLRKEKYNLDEEEIRPYFKLENVRQGVLDVATKLYGLKFVERKDLPKYHEDVITYEVFDADGSHLAILYMDFFPRASKRGGAWMTNYIEQYRKNGEMVYPVISTVFNFTKPTADAPSLLTADEVETTFHEFGHALHGMFSKCTYKSLAGTSVPRDFVELPSQVMENWAFEPEVLALYAKHYKTGKMIPNELVNKIKNSSMFNQGFASTELFAASYLDMAYHTITKPMTMSTQEFEKKEAKRLDLIPEIIYRYRSTYFNHSFAGGYSAGYYSYTWSAVLDADAFEAFKEHGLFDKATATSFRQNVLEKGKTEPAMTLYKRFRGAEPSIKPLMKKRGMIE